MPAEADDDVIEAPLEEFFKTGPRKKT